MTVSLLVSSIALLAASAQGFVPAPIRWGGVADSHFFLACAPRTFSDIAAARTQHLTSGDFAVNSFLDLRAAQPSHLTIQELSDKISLSTLPYFTAKLDNTISWEASGLCIEASGTQSGDAVRLNFCSGGFNQKWKWLPYGSVQLHGTNQCLDVNAAERNLNGAPVELMECTNEITELWKFDLPSPTPETPPHPSFASSARHVMISFTSIAMLGFLASLLWRWQGTGNFGVNEGASSLTLGDNGGVSLFAPSRARHGHGNTNGFVVNFQTSVLNNAHRRASNVSMQTRDAHWMDVLKFDSAQHVDVLERTKEYASKTSLDAVVSMQFGIGGNVWSDDADLPSWWKRRVRGADSTDVNVRIIAPSRRELLVNALSAAVAVPAIASAEVADWQDPRWASLGLRGTRVPLRSVESAAQADSIGTMALYPDPILRRTGAPVTSFGPSVEKVAELLVADMKSNAITALQYGVDARMIALKGPASPRATPIVFVNPTILSRSAETQMLSWREICLVLPPNLEIDLLRDDTVEVAAQDVRGVLFRTTLRGEPARAFQHELDHLDGILIIDHAGLDELPRDIAQLEAPFHAARQKRAFARKTYDGTWPSSVLFD